LLLLLKKWEWEQEAGGEEDNFTLSLQVVPPDVMTSVLRGSGRPGTQGLLRL